MRKYNLEELLNIKIIDKETKEVTIQKYNYKLANTKNVNPHEELIPDVQGKELL